MQVPAALARLAEEPDERAVLGDAAEVLARVATLPLAARQAIRARGFDERRFWISIPAGIVLAGAVWLVFARGLSLTLPHGPVEDAIATLASIIVGLAREVVATLAAFFDRLA